MPALPVPLHTRSDNLNGTSMQFADLLRATSGLDVSFDDSDSFKAVIEQCYTSNHGGTPNLRYLCVQKKSSSSTWPGGLAPSQQDAGEWNNIREVIIRGSFSFTGVVEPDALKTLLQRISASVSSLHLVPYEFDAPEGNIDDMIPEMSQLRTLTASNIPLRLLTGILKKSPSLRNIAIEARPSPEYDYNTSEPDEPDWDEGKGTTGSLKTNGSNRLSVRPSHLARALLNLRALNSASGIRIKSFTVTPMGEAANPRQTRLIAAGARIVLGLAALSRVTHLTLDRSLFTTLVARKVDLPKRLVDLRILFTEWDREDSEQDVWGVECARPELVFGLFAKQLKRSTYRSLRAVRLLYWQPEGSGKFVVDLQSPQWAGFKDVCAARRISVIISPVERFGKMFEIVDDD
ncbi:hypothetical protein BKA62DRAFT_756520 [Auriculariales sp. MPI-PUGE-AT-0066]|nr:hypothetical protein BKA62DRAFT_756520 [Auriculariales sp. MPI-PUGE-AT-0066]